MRAMVLAAGLGTRLRPITYEIPKPMVPVLNRPIMEHIVELAREHGYTQLVANLSHLPEQIRDHFGDGSRFGVQLSYSFEEELLGTAGGVRQVADFFAGDEFLVISGDALTDLDLGAMRAFHEGHDGVATLALKRVPDPSEYGVVITGDDGRIQGFQEKPQPGEALSELASCGIYMLAPEIFDYFPERDFVDWAMDVFPVLLENDVAFYGYETDAYWNDVGSLAEYLQGNLDGLTGAVGIARPGKEVRDGIVLGDRAELPSDADAQPPLLVGARTRIAPGARLEGPLVIGEDCSLGDGCSVKEAVLLPGCEIPAGAIVARAIAGRSGRLQSPDRSAA